MNFSNKLDNNHSFQLSFERVIEKLSDTNKLYFIVSLRHLIFIGLKTCQYSRSVYFWVNRKYQDNRFRDRLPRYISTGKTILRPPKNKSKLTIILEITRTLYIICIMKTIN